MNLEIAQLLSDLLKKNQTITIATAQSTLRAGETGLFSTPSGIVPAKALNFCTSKCLLIKINQAWVAVAEPSHQRIVSRHYRDGRINRRVIALPPVSVELETVDPIDDTGGGGDNGGGGGGDDVFTN